MGTIIGRLFGAVGPLNNITTIFKIIVFLATIGVGGAGIYKAASYVSNYEKLKAEVTTLTTVAKDQAVLAKDTVASTTVTNAAEVKVITQDAVVIKTHVAKKQVVIEQVDKINTQPAVSEQVKDKEVSAVYINALWSDYCDASAGSANQDGQYSKPAA